MLEVLKEFAFPLIAIDEYSITGSSITATKNISINEPVFQGHYPNIPIYPGVFIFEAVHQAILLYLFHSYDKKISVTMRSVRSIRFRSPVQPGDRLIITCEVNNENEEAIEVKAVCRNGDQLGAEIKLIYSIRSVA
ncbi:3-hydroxyacyl-[acyl-carrier-protein] dehydratase FabZ [compost metagenome]